MEKFPQWKILDRRVRTDNVIGTHRYCMWKIVFNLIGDQIIKQEESAAEDCSKSLY